MKFVESRASAALAPARQVALSISWRLMAIFLVWISNVWIYAEA
jgi:hypothetical protein